MLFLKTGQPADLTVCTYDANRPIKSGKKLELQGVTLTSYEDYGKANIKLKNGDTITFHPVLITKYNGHKVTP